MKHPSPEAEAKFNAWHEKQFSYGACRCKECNGRRRGMEAQALAAADAIESGDVAVGRDPSGLAAAAPAPHPDGELLRFDKLAAAPLASPRRSNDPFRHFRDAVKPTEPAPIRDDWFPPAPDNENDVPFLLPIDEPVQTSRGLYGSAEWEQAQREASEPVEYTSDGFILRYNPLAPERVVFKPWTERGVAKDKYAHAAAQAVHAKLSYEEARTRLEREFGVEAVGKAIDGLTKLLGIRDDVVNLARRSQLIADESKEVAYGLRCILGDIDADADE